MRSNWGKKKNYSTFNVMCWKFNLKDANRRPLFLSLAKHYLNVSSCGSRNPAHSSVWVKDIKEIADCASRSLLFSLFSQLSQELKRRRLRQVHTRLCAQSDCTAALHSLGRRSHTCSCALRAAGAHAVSSAMVFTMENAYMLEKKGGCGRVWGHKAE